MENTEYIIYIGRKYKCIKLRSGIDLKVLEKFGYTEMSATYKKVRCFKRRILHK